VTELGYLALGVKDLSHWRAFAGDFLGLELVDGDTPEQTFLRWDFWHHRIVLEDNPVDDVTAVGLRVSNDDDFEQLARKLSGENVRYTICSGEEASLRRVLRLMRLEDPMGNPIEIFHGPLVEFNKPFHPHRRMYGQFVTGPGGLGHCQLSGTDTSAFLRFYRMIGMRGDTEFKVEFAPGTVTEMAFVHCDDRQRQHVFAFGLPGDKRLNHVMVESNSVDDLLYTYELAREQNIPIVISLGRHSNDHQVSFYCTSSSGFMFEYGWGSRPAPEQTEYYAADFYGHRLNPD
jgi:2,3-dihydroxybiphenyl 1,2-dioxygenase